MLIVTPIQRRGYVLRLHPAPAIRQPQPRIAIAAVSDEAIPFAIGHQAISQRKRFDQHAVTRAFIVKGEATTFVADKRDPAGVLVPAKRCLCVFQQIGSVLCLPEIPAFSGTHNGFIHRRAKRVLEQRVFDIGHQQFDVLLFMRNAQCDQTA